MSRAYWERDVLDVPTLTGAASVMDCADLLDACRGLGIATPLEGLVLDVGCGTGRWADHCQAWLGFDLSARCVDWCNARAIGHGATRIDGPSGLSFRRVWAFRAEWVCCFSVFTHIGPSERAAYLRAFRVLARNLVVDVIPGETDTSETRLATAELKGFATQLFAAGWSVAAEYERTSPDGVAHRYYRCR